jgi:hypothetical protein
MEALPSEGNKQYSTYTHAGSETALTLFLGKSRMHCPSKSSCQAMFAKLDDPDAPVTCTRASWVCARSS